MIALIDIDNYKKIFDKYDGVVKTSDFVDAGYHHSKLRALMKEGLISKIHRGYYEWISDGIISDAVIINKLFPDAVVFLLSALYIYEYTDTTPNYWHLAVVKDSRKTRFNIKYPKIHPYFINENYMDIGISKESFEGHDISIFNRDRTICDVVRYSNKLNKEIVNQALQSYINDNRKNTSNLIKYAKAMRAETKVKTMLGMWL